MWCLIIQISVAPSAKPLVAKAPPQGVSKARARLSHVLPKGQQTKSTIVEAALGLATQVGLEGLSIGAVAEATHMSKSGVFAHFGSREDLQLSVVHEYSRRFEQEVFAPAMQEPRGLPRLQTLFANWMKRVAVEIESGCLFISGAAEFQDRPGPVRDALVSAAQNWLGALLRAVELAKQCGHLGANTSAHQMAFEIHGLILALHYEARFLKSPQAAQRAHQGFAHILARYGASQESTAVPLVHALPVPRPTINEE